MSEAFQYPLLAAAGFVCGLINVIAGGGSFLTLPILIFMGLPPVAANGTNRVAILLQNVVAVWSFDRYGVLDRRSILWAAAPATAGAVLGVWAALSISGEAFERILATLMVVISLWTLWGPQPKPPEEGDEAGAGGRRRYVALGAGFFLAGVYGGFIQAGVGFVILAVISFAGLDLVRGNAIKVLSILCFTAISLAIFAWQGKVVWSLGLVLAVGTVSGALVGARLTVLKGHAWLRKVVTATIIVFALKLWLG